MNEDYYHWTLGENILRDDRPTYLINLQYGLSIQYNEGSGYFTNYEEFYESIANVQFLSGHRPDKDTIEALKVEAWNFLALTERKEDELYSKRNEDNEH